MISICVEIEVFSLLIFLHLFLEGDSNLTWEKITTKGDVPPPRSGHSMCQFGKHIFLFGGIDFENEAIYNDLYMLNTGLNYPLQDLF